MSCERSSLQKTWIPDGMCVAWQAVFTLFTFCPPFPPARTNWNSMSFSLKSSRTSPDSTSGIRTTVAVDVWIRPAASVAGTLCTRCVPASYFSFEYTSSPLMARDTSERPPPSFRLNETTLHSRPSSSQNFLYMPMRSSAQSEASSPPAPGLISRRALLASSRGSFGSIDTCRVSFSAFLRSYSPASSSWANSAISPPADTISAVSSISSATSSSSSYVSTILEAFASSLAFFAYSVDWNAVGLDMNSSSCSLFFRASATLLTKRASRPILSAWLFSAAFSSAVRGTSRTGASGLAAAGAVFTAAAASFSASAARSGRSSARSSAATEVASVVASAAASAASQAPSAAAAAQASSISSVKSTGAARSCFCTSLACGWLFLFISMAKTTRSPWRSPAAWSLCRNASLPLNSFFTCSELMKPKPFCSL
mmetsp:Transcript_96663/g.262604  ORF Transcript_96663/g.262604 Transcript_96663/m.262604 type:complete len:426 (-) Transcript_96663:150-1427(-)